MSDEKQIVVAQASGNFNMAMLKKVKGLDENSPLRRMQSSGEYRLTVDGNQFQIKKGGKLLQTLKDGKKPIKELDVVIHFVSPVIQKQAALKYDPKNPKFEPLGCWSNDGNRPDDVAWNKQGQHCDTCKYGGGAEVVDKDSGKIATCGLTRQAVVSIYSPTQEPEQYFLMNFNWSSNSTKKKGEDMDVQQYCMINYLNMLAEHEVDTHRIVTRLVVDDWSDPKNNSKLLFQPVATVMEGDPNFLAHERWVKQFEEQDKDFQDLIKISQHKPRDAADSLPATGVESDGEDEEAEETPAQKKKRIAAEKAAATKAKAKKAAELKKKREAEEEEEEEEEIDIDELDSIGDDDGEEDEEQLTVEDDDDFGDLDDLLAED